MVESERGELWGSGRPHSSALCLKHCVQFGPSLGGVQVRRASLEGWVFHCVYGGGVLSLIGQHRRCPRSCVQGARHCVLSRLCCAVVPPEHTLSSRWDWDGTEPTAGNGTGLLGSALCIPGEWDGAAIGSGGER